MPFAVIDLDALEHNVGRLSQPLAGSGKTLRIATKSVRCPDVVDRIRAAAGPVARGLMTYTASETAFWAERGERDLLLAYPTVPRRGRRRGSAGINAGGATAAIVVDGTEHLEALGAAGRAQSTRIPVVLDVDMSLPPARRSRAHRRAAEPAAERAGRRGARATRGGDRGTELPRRHGVRGADRRPARPRRRGAS